MMINQLHLVDAPFKKLFHQKSGKLIFALRDFDMQRISALYARPEYKGVLKVEAGTAPRVSLRLRSNARIVDQARKFIKDFSEAF